MLKDRSRLVHASICVALALLGAASVACAPAGGSFAKGPAPTNAGIEAPTGPFATATVAVPRRSDFGGGMITYPTDTSQGTYGAVVVIPPFLGPEFVTIRPFGERLASQGFVVITIDTLNGTDQPPSRADQGLAALDYLVSPQSTVASRIDRNRLAVMGHSMGGGGALDAALQRPSLKAAIAMAPWNGTKTWPGIVTPTLILSGDNDTIAPANEHADQFYEGIPASTEKLHIKLANADHFTPASSVTTYKYSIAWLKRFVDLDQRYDQFLCPTPTSPLFRTSASNCPF